MNEKYIYRIFEECEIEMSRKLNIFLSYDNDDTDYFLISSIAEFLEAQDSEIEKVYYWERDTELGQTFKEYMKDSIKNSDLVLFFCSVHSKESKNVEKEVCYAEAFDKRGIPIFDDEKNILDDLKGNRGLKFNASDFPRFCSTLYQKVTGKTFQSIENRPKNDLIEPLDQKLMVDLTHEEQVVLGYFYVTKLQYYLGPFDNPKCYPGEELATFTNEAHIDFMLKILPKLTKAQIKDLILQLYNKSFLEKEEGHWSNKKTIFWTTDLHALDRYDPGAELTPIIQEVISLVEGVYNIIKSNPLVLELLFLKENENAPEKYILNTYAPDLKDYKFLLLDLDILALKKMLDILHFKKDTLLSSINDRNENILSKLGEVERILLYFASNYNIIMDVQNNIDYNVSQKTIDKWEKELDNTHPNFSFLINQIAERLNISGEVVDKKNEWMIEMGFLTLGVFGERVTITKLGGYPIFKSNLLNKRENKICNKIQTAMQIPN